MHDQQIRPTGVNRLIKFLMSLPGREVLLNVENNNTLIRASNLDWTIARYPMQLTSGPQTGHYRTGYLGENVSMRLSRAGGADFIIKELAKGEFIKKAPVISY